MSEETSFNPVELATELTIAWLGNQNVRVVADEVPAFLRSMHATILALAAAPAGGEDADGDAPSETFPPAVSVRKSLASRDHIVSLIDGKPYKALRRHLARHGLTPEQYRERYNLKPDYPMVAEAYSEQRRAMAKRIGLGSKGRQAKAQAADETPTPRRRKPA